MKNQSNRARLIIILTICILPLLYFVLSNVFYNKGKFELAGSLENITSDITSLIPLENGDAFILQTGPVGQNSYYSIYNNKTKSFSFGGNLIQAYDLTKSNPKAIMLNNGRILILGQLYNRHDGTDMAKKVAYGELYDPKTNIISLTGENIAPAIAFSAIKLQDGKVLIVGCGENNKMSEIYDPKTNEFTLTGDLNTRRIHPSLVLLKNGNVVVFGGAKKNQTVELYDKSKGVFKVISENYPIMGYMAIMGEIFGGDETQTFVLKDGQIIILSYNISNNINIQMAFYNPLKNEFRVIKLKELKNITNFQATLLSNDTILFTGGMKGRGKHQGYEYLSSAEIFDPKSEKFTFINTKMKYARAYHDAALLNDGSVLILKGNDNGKNIKQAELFIPAMPH